MTGTTAKLDSKTEKLAEIATETAAETPAPSTEPTSEAKDWEAEAKKWKELSRHNEARARENAEKAKAFDELEEANKTELQKAMERAEAAEKELGQLRVQTKRAEIAAEYGVPVSLVSGSTAEEMTENAKALKEWRGEPAPQATPVTPPPSTSSVSAGATGAPVGTIKQFTRADLQGMSTKEINAAVKAGHFNDIMSGKQ